MEPVIATVRGRKVEIPLGLKRPILNDFHDFENWLMLEQEFAVGLKERLESGETSVRSVRSEMIEWSTRAEELFKRMGVLKVEERLLYLNLQIRTFLSNEKRNPKYCVNYLEELNKLEFTSLMLLKNPEVIDTIDRVTRYEGEIPEPCTSRMMVESIKCDEEIKKAANRVMRKFREMFKVPDEKSFSEVYKKELAAFEKQTEQIDRSELLLMVDRSMIRGKKGSPQ